jgi:ElaB/YqjD/DUF883 family membrane-anchored ribosome-binding protein
MAETKYAVLEQRAASFERELSEARSVISKRSRQIRETTTVVGTLTQDVSELKQALKRTQEWVRESEKNRLSSGAGISRYE